MTLNLLTDSTITFDQIEEIAVPITYGAGGVAVTINALVLVACQGDDAIFSNQSSSVLINNGSIFSGSKEGVDFLDAGGSIINNRGASIAGFDTAINIRGSGSASITNHGVLISYRFVAVDFSGSSANTVLDNHGVVYGHTCGVRAISSISGGVIHNFGTIRSDTLGIVYETSTSGLTTIVDNAAGAVIQGSEAAISSSSFSAGRLSLNNRGIIDGAISLGAGNFFHDATGKDDFIRNSGTIKGFVLLGLGNDTFNGAGGTSGPVLGDAGNDRLVGGGQADRLHGGDNNDILTGRLGADRFFFDTALNAVTNVDRINDFSPAQHDKIVLSEADFLNLGALGVLGPGHFHVGGPVKANAQIDYHPGNGFLFYDRDGNGATYAPIHFATLGLATHPVIHNTDFIVIA